MWIMWVLHVVAVMFFPLALFVTIPFHIVMAFQGSKQAQSSVVSQDGSIVPKPHTIYMIRFEERLPSDWQTARGELSESAGEHGIRTIERSTSEEFVMRAPGEDGGSITMTRAGGIIEMLFDGVEQFLIPIAAVQKISEEDLTPKEELEDEWYEEDEIDTQDRLIKLGQMVRDGLLTEEEFAAQKAKLLSQS